MVKKLAWLGVCLIFGIAMIPKLYKAAKVREWVAGARTEVKTIAKKWMEDKWQVKRGTTTYYYIAWEGRQNTSLNIPEKYWSAIEVGDTVPILYIGDDPDPYLREGIWASNGNIALDVVLLVGGWAGAAFIVRSILKEMRDGLGPYRPAGDR